MLSDSLSAMVAESPTRILLPPRKNNNPNNYTHEFTSDSERRLAEERKAAVSMEQELADIMNAPAKEVIIPPPAQTEIDPVFYYPAGRIALFLLSKTANNRTLAYSALEDTASSNSWKLDTRGRAFYAQMADSMRVMVSDEGVVVYDGAIRLSLASGDSLFNKLRNNHPEADNLLTEQDEIGESIFALHVDVNDEEPKPKELDNSDILFELLDIEEDGGALGLFGETDPDVLREVIPPMTLEEENHLFDYYPDPSLEIEYEDEFEQRIAEVKAPAKPADIAAAYQEAEKAMEGKNKIVAESVEVIKAKEEPMSIKKSPHNHLPDGGSSPRTDCPACMENHNAVSEKYAAAGLSEPKKYAHEVADEQGDKQIRITGTQHYLKSVQGRVLTIMEAAFPDKEQRDAIKTLIKKEFRREMDKVHRHITFNEGEAGEESD